MNVKILINTKPNRIERVVSEEYAKKLCNKYPHDYKPLNKETAEKIGVPYTTFEELEQATVKKPTPTHKSSETQKVSQKTDIKK